MAHTPSVPTGVKLTDATANAQAFAAKSAGVNGPRILVLDIETFPLLVYTWGLFKQHITLDQMHTDWSMMSFAAKWLGQDGMFYADNRHRADPRDDFEQLWCLHFILSEADMVIAHNGAKFDLPKIRARMAINGFPPLPPITVIDTFQLQAKAFGFTSQKLQYVAGLAGDRGKDSHKNFPGLSLWKECLAHNPAAWEECRIYNCQDVTENEAMYLSLRGWYKNAPNFGPYVTDTKPGEHVCPSCGGTHVIRKGSRKTQVGIYPRYKCTDCGSWSRGRLMEASRDSRSHILAS